MEEHTTKVGFHIPASIELDGHVAEEMAIEKFVQWWDNASDEEKLDAFTESKGSLMAENIAYIDHITTKKETEVVAEW